MWAQGGGPVPRAFPGRGSLRLLVLGQGWAQQSPDARCPRVPKAGSPQGAAGEQDHTSGFKEEGTSAGSGAHLGLL